jgi:hypothetical protein
MYSTAISFVNEMLLLSILFHLALHFRKSCSLEEGKVIQQQHKLLGRRHLSSSANLVPKT